MFNLIVTALTTGVTSVDNVERLIGTLGFPIVICGVTIYLNWRQNQQHREDIKQLNKEHKEEVDKLSGALENNTLAMQKLVTVLESTGG